MLLDDEKNELHDEEPIEEDSKVFKKTATTKAEAELVTPPLDELVEEVQEEELPEMATVE